MCCNWAFWECFLGKVFQHSVAFFWFACSGLSTFSWILVASQPCKSAYVLAVLAFRQVFVAFRDLLTYKASSWICAPTPPLSRDQRGNRILSMLDAPRHKGWDGNSTCKSRKPLFVDVCAMPHDTHPQQKNWRNSGGELQVHSRESMPFSCQVAQGTKCHVSRSSAISEKQCLAYAWHVGHAQSERIAVAKCAFFLVEWRSKSDSIQHVAPFSNNISLGKAKDEAWHGKTCIINTQPGTIRTIPSPQSFPDPRATSVVLEWTPLDWRCFS